MIYLVESANYFNPLSEDRRTELPSGFTILESIQMIHPDFVEFDLPTICLLNGKPTMRKDWITGDLKDGDVVTFITIPEGFTELAIYIIVAVVAVAASILLMPSIPNVQPPTTSEIPEADPVYALTGRQNQTRLSSPIQVSYGRVRMWPSYGAAPFNQYSGNDQYLYQLFCLGQGHYTIHETYIEDTPISQFQEVTIQYAGPGQSITLFPDNVETSSEVGSIELLAPNEPGSGYVGPFVANTAFTLANILEVDIVLPKGLYYSEDDGTLSDKTITVDIEYREIDDAGDPVGSWTLMSTFTKTMNTNTPQRFTVSGSVSQGRYEMRCKRTDNKDDSHRAGHKVVWESMRAFLPSTKDYGNVTMLAVRARATNNLNNQSKSRINVEATRELVSWDKGSQSFNPRAATRSIAWAMYDLLSSDYGGQMADEFIDLDGFYDLDQIWTSRNNYFDWVFDKKLTVWEAAKTIAGAGRAKPILNASKVVMVRDSTKTLPSGVFTPDNIVEGSFSWEVGLFNIDEHDGLEVEYLDPTTWKPEVVPCLLPGDTNINPAHVRLAGVTGRQHAFEEGMYLRSRSVKLREVFSFATGLEGQIPFFGDLISISHDVPKWADAGHIVEKVGLLLTLSKDVVFEPSTTHKIVFRKKDGSGDGPFTVLETAQANQVLLESEPGTEFYFDPNREPMYFAFGQEDMQDKKGIVTSIRPTGTDDVLVEATVYDPSIFAYDGVSAPPLDSPTIPPQIPSLPVVTGTAIETIANNLTQIIVSWQPAVGASSYSVQRSPDGINWTDVGTIVSTSTILSVEAAGLLYVRVAGINDGIGPWNQTSAVVGEATTIPNNPANLALVSPFVGTQVDITWSAASLASYYTVKVWDADPTTTGASVLRSSDVSTTAFTYTITDMETDGTPQRNLWFEVIAVNGQGNSDNPPVLAVSNPIPAVPANPSSLLKTDNSPNDIVYEVSWDQVNETDIDNYRVYGSDTPGFTPGPSNLVAQGFATALEVTIALDTSGSHPQFYWVVAAEDVWGTEINPTAEQSIAAYP